MPALCCLLPMSSYIKFLLTITVCFYLTMPVVAQTNGGTPEAVAQNYWAAMQAAEWTKSADLIHSQSLRRIRKSSDEFVATLITFGEGNLISFFGVASREEYVDRKSVV